MGSRRGNRRRGRAGPTETGLLSERRLERRRWARSKNLLFFNRGGGEGGGKAPSVEARHGTLSELFSSRADNGLLKRKKWPIFVSGGQVTD